MAAVPIIDEQVRLGPGTLRCFRTQDHARLERGRLHRFVTVEERTFELVDLQFRVQLEYRRSA
ncbi:hypothetical protein [Limnochorda pilosa]|uniref:Uncharacterized protein n=1 Tax=Limnochorda pilosa TaxID=1555112 RepID=A0A0K2SMJ2_LIMPI|nr:hypothetical protein [Limnochorda pilosa]BAS28348.1 hypothetical protein LIP_2518 [Limnochorda pilosa]